MQLNEFGLSCFDKVENGLQEGSISCLGMVKQKLDIRDSKSSCCLLHIGLQTMRCFQQELCFDHRCVASPQRKLAMQLFTEFCEINFCSWMLDLIPSTPAAGIKRNLSWETHVAFWAVTFQ